MSSVVNIICMAVANWPVVEYMPELTDDQMFGVKSGRAPYVQY